MRGYKTNWDTTYIIDKEWSGVSYGRFENLFLIKDLMILIKKIQTLCIKSIILLAKENGRIDKGKCPT